MGSLESLTLPEAASAPVQSPVPTAYRTILNHEIPPEHRARVVGAHVTFSPNPAAVDSLYRTPTRNHSTTSLLQLGRELLTSGVRSHDPTTTLATSRRRGTNGSRNVSPTRRPKLGSCTSSVNLLRSQSGTASLMHSPKLEAMMKQSSMPDLASVNRALSELHLAQEHASEEDNIWTGNLTHLAETLSHASRDRKWLLNHAMQERSKGNTEICRAHCVEIVNNQYAEVETKIYAYNILSTQASVGRAQGFLDESEKLVKENAKGHSEVKRLEAVIESLRLSAQEREAACRGNDHRREHEVGETDGERAVSPKSSKILRWASGVNR